LAMSFTDQINSHKRRENLIHKSGPKMGSPCD
jgi:hypothetical protein